MDQLKWPMHYPSTYFSINLFCTFSVTLPQHRSFCTWRVVEFPVQLASWPQNLKAGMRGTCGPVSSNCPSRSLWKTMRQHYQCVIHLDTFSLEKDFTYKLSFFSSMTSFSSSPRTVTKAKGLPEPITSSPLMSYNQNDSGGFQEKDELNIKR